MTTASLKMTLEEYLNYDDETSDRYELVQRVTVLEWVEGFYEEKVYAEGSLIVSPLLGRLELTTAQLLEGR